MADILLKIRKFIYIHIFGIWYCAFLQQWEASTNKYTPMTKIVMMNYIEYGIFHNGKWQSINMYFSVFHSNLILIENHWILTTKYKKCIDWLIDCTQILFWFFCCSFVDKIRKKSTFALHKFITKKSRCYKHSRPVQWNVIRINWMIWFNVNTVTPANAAADGGWINGCLSMKC